MPGREHERWFDDLIFQPRSALLVHIGELAGKYCLRAPNSSLSTAVSATTSAHHGLFNLFSVIRSTSSRLPTSSTIIILLSCAYSDSSNNARDSLFCCSIFRCQIQCILPSIASFIFFRSLPTPSAFILIKRPDSLLVVTKKSQQRCGVADLAKFTYLCAAFVVF